MTAPEAVQVIDRTILLALAIASRFSKQFPPLADEFRSAVGYELWRAALRYRGSSEQFTAGLTAVVAKRACYRLIRVHQRRAAHRVDADPAEMDLPSREC